MIETKIEDKGTEKITPGPIAIEFDDLSFAYIEDDYVLNNVSFKLEPGKTSVIDMSFTAISLSLILPLPVLKS